MTAVDSSVVVPALSQWHDAHEEARAAASGSYVPAHALLESYSVLTRLPSPHRLSPDIASQLLTAWFPPERVLHLPARSARTLVTRLAGAGVSGGASYDALVGATAAEHDEELRTRDRRAAATYEALGVRHNFV